MLFEHWDIYGYHYDPIRFVLRYGRNLFVAHHGGCGILLNEETRIMSNDYYNIWQLTTLLLPQIAMAVFIPAALLGLMHRALRNL